MSFLIPAALGALGGLFGGNRRNQEDKANYEQARLQRSDQQQALRRRQYVLARLFQQYKFDPSEWGFGNALSAGGFENPTAPGSVQPFTMESMPEFRGTPWWQNALGGAVGGIGQYFANRPEEPRAVPGGGGGAVGGFGGTEFRPDEIPGMGIPPAEGGYALKDRPRHSF